MTVATCVRGAPPHRRPFETITVRPRWNMIATDSKMMRLCLCVAYQTQEVFSMGFATGGGLLQKWEVANRHLVDGHRPRCSASQRGGRARAAAAREDAHPRRAQTDTSEVSNFSTIVSCLPVCLFVRCAWDAIRHPWSVTTVVFLQSMKSACAAHMRDKAHGLRLQKPTPISMSGVLVHGMDILEHFSCFNIRRQA